jgi:hypothetical protein
MHIYYDDVEVTRVGYGRAWRAPFELERFSFLFCCVFWWWILSLGEFGGLERGGPCKVLGKTMSDTFLKILFQDSRSF